MITRFNSVLNRAGGTVRWSLGVVPSRWSAVAAIAIGLLAPGSALAAPKLRYHFEPGRQYAYEIKIVATLPDATETREGLCYLNAKTVAGQEFTLTHTGNLGVRRQPLPGSDPFRRPNFGAMFPWGEGPIFRAGGQFVVSDTGRLIKTEVGTSLPYLLGDLEFLSIEEFPADAQSKWEQKRAIVIAEREQSRFPRRPFGSTEPEVKRSAQEVMDFSVKQTTGDTVRLHKQQTLRSEELVGGNPKYQMSGEGDLVFDTKQGVFVSQAMKYTISWNDNNVTVKIPITVDCRLLDASELEARLKEQKAAQATAQAAIAKANEPKSLEAGERDKMLRDLKARDEWAVRAAADRLAKAPADQKPEDIAAALTALLSDRNNSIRASAAKALVNWATADSVPGLRAAVGDNDLWLRKAAMEALVRFPSAENATAIAARLVEMGDRGDAVKALEKMGPVAEPAVLAYLKDRDGWVRLEACKLLGKIGSAQSLPALEEFGAHGQGFDKPESDKAIDAIKARGGK